MERINDKRHHGYFSFNYFTDWLHYKLENFCLPRPKIFEILKTKNIFVYDRCGLWCSTMADGNQCSSFLDSVDQLIYGTNIHPVRRQFCFCFQKFKKNIGCMFSTQGIVLSLPQDLFFTTQNPCCLVLKETKNMDDIIVTNRISSTWKYLKKTIFPSSNKSRNIPSCI